MTTMDFHVSPVTDKGSFYSFAATSPDRIHVLGQLHKPAFTEAVAVGCHADAFSVTLGRLYEGAMELDTSQHLQRTLSHQSNASSRSQRSRTVRSKPRTYASYASSRSSSVTPSDKSLTSFPSFSPESPRDGRLFRGNNDDTGTASRKPSYANMSTVDILTGEIPSQIKRHALFDDEPLSTQHVPGAIHQASDEHIKRLIARTGAVTLVRQIAGDLAQRDSQIAALRRKAEERERALRKIVLECGLSNLDLETRLRAIEDESRAIEESNMTSNGGIRSLINDAMDDSAGLDSFDTLKNGNGDATIRASEAVTSGGGSGSRGTAKGWKEFFWGNGTSKRTSRASSINSSAVEGPKNDVMGPPKIAGRRTVLQNGIFQAPETGLMRSTSRASSMQSGRPGLERKPSTSLASMALKLVAGNSNITRESNNSNPNRGRSDSAAEAHRTRVPSASSVRSSLSMQTAQSKQFPKNIPTPRRSTVAVTAAQDRWDTMGASPQGVATGGTENYGPVELDTILPPEAQPPTSTVYNNNFNPEFLTDRFGFIYDQRRKKRQRDAADIMRKTKRGSRLEMLSSARGNHSPTSVGFDEETDSNSQVDRPDTPASNEDRGEDGKPAKRWQDYLKIATFPTELLSHTPSGSLPTLEVFQSDDTPKSPSKITENRGLLPTVGTTPAPPAISLASNNATMSTPTALPIANALEKEDVEPVKLLLEQLSEVHDSLQREKTVKWNDFLRKVRAERKREGEAAAAALAATAETRSQRIMAAMPEVTLSDGEMIGVAGLGNKGKVGRAKWNEFKNLLLGGIPVAYRAKIWAECSGATALRIPGYYEDLVANRDSDDDPIIVAQIQMDINRTLTDNIFFRRGPGVAKLSEVLLAYSRRNKEVGYCQGMNLITACLLLIMPAAEDAFWVLTSIIENILPRGYYDHSLLASRADQQVLRQYVTEILPRLSAHLEDLGIELEALTFQWFLSIFTDCLSAEALFRTWDIILCTNDGSTFLFQVALALLKLNEQQLLQCSTPASVYLYINHQMTNHAISIDGLIHASEGLRKVVRREDVESRRGKAINGEKEMIRQREARNKVRMAERSAAMNGKADEIEVQPASEDEAKSSSSSQLELSTDAFGKLTVRSPLPIPMEEEAYMGLG